MKRNLAPGINENSSNSGDPFFSSEQDLGPEKHVLLKAKRTLKKL